MLSETGTNELLVLLLHCFEFSKQPRIWMNASLSFSCRSLALGLPLIIEIRSTDNYFLYCIIHPGVAPGIFRGGG